MVDRQYRMQLQTEFTVNGHPSPDNGHPWVRASVEELPLPHALIAHIYILSFILSRTSTVWAVLHITQKPECKEFEF